MQEMRNDTKQTKRQQFCLLQFDIWMSGIPEQVGSTDEQGLLQSITSVRIKYHYSEKRTQDQYFFVNNIVLFDPKFVVDLFFLETGPCHLPFLADSAANHHSKQDKNEKSSSLYKTVHIRPTWFQFSYTNDSRQSEPYTKSPLQWSRDKQGKKELKKQSHS